jgi:hypothetical protein
MDDIRPQSAPTRSDSSALTTAAFRRALRQGQHAFVVSSVDADRRHQSWSRHATHRSELKADRALTNRSAAIISLLPCSGRDTEDSCGALGPALVAFATELFRISRKHRFDAAVPARRHRRSKLPLNSSSHSITKGGNAIVPVASAVPRSL